MQFARNVSDAAIDVNDAAVAHHNACGYLAVKHEQLPFARNGVEAPEAAHAHR